MKGLLIKDLYNLRKALSMYCAIVVILMVYCALTKKSVFLPMVPVLIFSTMITGTFTKDNNIKWDKLAVTMPLTRSRIVCSRYILFSIIMVLSIVVGIGAAAISWLNADVKIVSEIELLLLSTEIAMVSGGVSMLLLFIARSIIDKVELVTVISYIIGTAVTFGLHRLLDLFIDSKIVMFSVGVIVGIVFVIVSCKISAYYYNKKELE